MLRLLFGALAACFAAQTAYAAAYDDFAAGVTAFVRNDYAQADSLLSAALKAPDLVANLRVTAYLDRARIAVAEGKCEQALQDVQAAEALDADAIETAEIFAGAESCKGDYQAAIERLTKELAVVKVPRLYFDRALTLWQKGDFAGAETDFDAFRLANPRSPYPVLWQALAQWRSGKSEAAALDDMPKMYLDFWPKPLVELYRGDAKPGDVLAAAVAKNDVLPVTWSCEANFYVGEWQLAHNNPAAGRTLLEKAGTTCPHGSIELQVAKADLAGLK